MAIKVSVCVPMYNVEAYIARCAESLFRQTLRQEMEFIFVDDHTPDRSVEVLSEVIAAHPEVSAQIKVLHHEENRGLRAARTTALQAVSGEYVIFCDSDDWVEPTLYERLYTAAKRASAELSYCAYCLDDGMGGQRVVPIAQCTTRDELLGVILGDNRHWNVWAKLVKREIACAQHYYLPETICFGEDLLYAVQVIAQCQTVACCPEPLYHYFCGNGLSYTRTFKRSSFDQLQAAILALIERFPQYDFSACQGELLFKAVLHGLLTREEFQQYSASWRAKIVRKRSLPLLKRLILLSAFVQYGWTVKALRALRGRK